MLNHRIAIFIPSTRDGNKPAPELHDLWLRKAKERFAKLFGGFTATAAQGGWWSDAHGLIEENVTIVHANTDDAGLAKVEAVREFAVLLQQAMGQEAVSLEVDNSLEFVSVQSETQALTG
jgi:hypothetical protein